MNEHYPFRLIPLPYPYDSLEPYIDEETMNLHHNAHLKGYVDKLNTALKDYPQYHNWTLTRLINNSGALPDSIRQTVKNAAGGVLNHNMFFTQLINNELKNPVGEFADALAKQFNSIEYFKEIFIDNAKNLFGSGWTFLVMDIRPESFGRFKILNLANQDTPASESWTALLLADVWEHAYYLKYKNKRADYLEALWNVLGWEYVNKIYINELKRQG